MALADTRPCSNPLVRGIHNLCQVVIGHRARGQSRTRANKLDAIHHLHLLCACIPMDLNFV